MQIFGSQVLVVADRVRPGQFGHKVVNKVVKPGQRIWEGELLSDDEPIYDPRAHERLDFTIDDESQDRE